MNYRNGAVVLTLAAVVSSGCRRNAQVAPDRLPPTRVQAAPMAPRGEAWQPSTGCAAQAARVAAHGVWRGSSMNRAHDGPLRWAGHYSRKYDECYVLIDQLIPIQSGGAAVVSELWDAFGAMVLAESTDDPRTSVRRSFCQVNLSDDTFTSCAVSRYFIDEHMNN